MFLINFSKKKTRACAVLTDKINIFSAVNCPSDKHGGFTPLSIKTYLGTTKPPLEKWRS